VPVVHPLVDRPLRRLFPVVLEETTWISHGTPP
jgi:hypothetical protein